MIYFFLENIIDMSSVEPSGYCFNWLFSVDLVLTVGKQTKIGWKLY